MNNATNTQGSQSSLTPSEDGTVAVPRASIDWYRSLPWWRLLSQSIVISWRASHLLLAGIAIWLTYAGWLLSEKTFAPQGITASSLFTDRNLHPTFEFAGACWHSISEAAEAPITVRRLAYFAFGFLWTTAVWSFAGGLLARRSLMEMGVRTSVGWGPSCRLVRQRWLSMIWAICMPIIAIVGLALIPLGLGLFARFGVIGQSISLIFMLPAVVLSIGIGWCAAISMFGFPLSICAISAEKNADAFDGVARSAAYVFQRPMTILTIGLLAIGLGWLGDTIIRTILSCGEQVVWASFSMGFGSNIRDQLGEEALFRKSLISIGKAFIPTLQAAFLVSFFWSTAAAAYLTLRWEIDNTDFDDLDLQELGEPVQLPSFKQDSRGVSEIAEATS